MQDYLAALVDACRRHAAIVTLALVLVAVLGGVFTAQHIALDSDVNKLISPALPWRQREAAMDKAFPQNDDILAIVLDGTTADLAADGADALAKKLATMPQLFTSVRVAEGGTFFRREGILFLSKEEVQSFADQIIAAQPFIGTLAADPSLRGVFTALDLLAQGETQGAIDAKSLDTPLGTVATSVEVALAGKSAPLSWQTLLTGRTPEPRELRRFVIVKPVLDYDAVAPGAEAAEAVRASARELGLTPERGVTVKLTGPVAFQDDQLSTLSEGAGFTTALSLGLLVLWLSLGLRSARLVAAILVTLIVGLTLCATFAVGVVGPLNPISAAFAVLFVGLAIDFGIQLSVRYRDERFHADDLAEALRRTARGVGGPLVIAAAATSVGFLAFVPTDYVGVSDLGLIAGVGMLIALALNLTLLPSLLTLLRPKGETHAVGFAGLGPLDRFLIERRGLVMALAGVIALAAAAVLPRLSFDFNPLDLQNQKSEAMQVLNELKSDPDDTPYTAEVLLPNLDAATALAKRLDALPDVAHSITVASFVPDDQQAKIAILSDASTLLGPTLSPPTTKPAPSDAEILTALATTAKDMKAAGDKGSAAAAHLADLLNEALAKGAAIVPALKDNLARGLENRLDDLRLTLSAQPVTLATIPDDVKRDWITPDGRARVSVFPKGGAPDNAAIKQFVAAVRSVTDDATGTPVTIQDSADTVTHAFAVAGLIAVIAIAVLLTIVLRRAWDVAMVLAPLALAGLLTLATATLLGLSLNFANIITLPLLLGIGVAFDIYFVMRWRAGDSGLLESSTARAILFSALTTGTAFGSLAISHNPAMAEMGKLLSLALAFTLLCTFLVLPALLGPQPRSP